MNAVQYSPLNLWDEPTIGNRADTRLATLTEEARQSAQDLPMPPASCPSCRDTFTAVWYRPVTVERVWSCGTASCDCYKGVSL